MTMLRTALALGLWLAAGAAAAQARKPAPAPSAGQGCVDCHQQRTPAIVADWKASRHAAVQVDCATCHGDAHRGNDDVAKALIPTPETCAQCHEAQVAQFKKGKHALAWASVKAMPTFHYQPLAIREGLKGCGGCHKLGLKSPAELKELKEASGGFGVASCDACHTRHLFSKAEARRPEACQTCHMGFDHPQWEMYSGSKHGVRNALKQQKAIPEDAAAPTCQTCHMQEGNHEVRTAWGFLALRLPFPEDDPQWKADRITILQGLGVLDPKGNPTARLDAVKGADMARLTQEAFDAERAKTLRTCNPCHSANFAKEQLRQSEGLLRDADHLMAEGIREVAALYQDGVLQKPKGYASAFPDLLTFHDAPTPVEQTLFVMFLEHRMRAFQGAFHANPDYANWYGWSELQRDLVEIRAMAEDMRRVARKPAAKAAAKPRPSPTPAAKPKP
ncbi:multihaem cytochrome [Anaeromyxobacter sp. K]|uniref:multiheme c-type cytochrome n=1 Tax=Anaeromyxobacter sp. (strain K) TaxID=447217 RepID=UPI00015F88DB|nr:multiheme c-type cytochrome [Anaeromyxobacter sp. K]ACG72191.1 multihaem cytochrome [Anaeromyxobacter sp. K]